MLYIKYMEQQQDKAIPEAIKRLRLCASLKDCGHSVESCFKQSSAKLLYAYDDEVLGYSDWNKTVTPEDVSRTFIVHNDNAVEIILLPLDNRIISGPVVTKGGVNDCAILTERQISFVEFKTNVTSNSEQNIGDKTDDAIAQLWHTYNEIISPRCSSKGISLATSVEIDFFVIFDSNLDVTNTTASRLDKQMEFLEKNKFPLFFDNEKSFI